MTIEDVSSSNISVISNNKKYERTEVLFLFFTEPLDIFDSEIEGNGTLHIF